MSGAGTEAAPRPGREPTSQRVLPIAGALLMAAAIAVSLVLGTVGWFALGFGVLTDCTNNYGCTEAGCPPCDPAARWIDAGGVAQLGLASAGIAWFVVASRSDRWRPFVVGGVALLAASAVTAVGTTWRANESYCRAGTPGFAESYCPVDG